MNSSFDSKRLWWFVWILGAIVVAKSIWVAAEWLVPLPVSATEQIQNTVKHRLHYRYRLASDTKIKTPTKSRNKPVKPVPKATLKAYQLVAVYSRPGYAVVTLVRGSKSFVLTSDPDGGDVEGFHLKEANATAARFQKDEKIVTLRLSEKKIASGAVSQVKAQKPRSKTVPPKEPRTPKKPDEKESAPMITEAEDGTREVNRSLIREYSESPEKIWKNIGLNEVKSEGKLDGFKVRFVRKGSPFEKLGLQRGDVIKAINGEPIVDYATPMQMLRSADTIDELTITIERNHEEQELKYEVK